MFQVMRLRQYSCPGSSSQTISYYYGGMGTIISVGFQNVGNAQSFWVSQMFVDSAAGAYWQVLNNAFTSTEWYPVIVLYIEDGGPEVREEDFKAEVETVPLEKGAPSPGFNS